MTRHRLSVRLTAAGFAVATWSGVAAAQTPSAEQMLSRAPVMTGVQVSTPTGADLSACRVEAVPFPKPATGLRLVDGQNRLVRQFVDTAGRGRPNMVYFYLNGVEAYREIDANSNGRPDQFRWLGVNGGKWGADTDEDGLIDRWYVISPAEVAQELFLALQTRDAKRLAPLILTADDIKTMQLPAAEADKLLSRVAGLNQRFTTAATTLALPPAAKWIHAEVGVPFVIAGDSLGNKVPDLVKLPTVTVLYEHGDGKSADLFQTGELVQVGSAWKLVEGPAAGAAQPTLEPGQGVIPVPDSVKDVVAQLQAVAPPANPAQQGQYHAQRAQLLEQIVAATTGEAQQPWLRQYIDALRSAAVAGDAASLTRLKQIAGKLAQNAPQTPTAAYAAFKVLDAEYTARMMTGDPASAVEVQSWWREQLEGYVSKYPGSEEAPEAMMSLAVACEFAGPKGETDAQKWYEKLSATFPDDPRAARASGAVKRLQSAGEAFKLPAATTLDGKPFDPAALAGKPTLVYYFANWSPDAQAEARIAEELKKLGEVAKGANVLTISLDESPERAQAVLTAAKLTGTHLHAAGGLDRSPLAVAYGIQMVPHLMLLDKTGKVANRNAQAGPGLAIEVEKLAK